MGAGLNPHPRSCQIGNLVGDSETLSRMSGRFDLIDKGLGKVRSRDIGNPVLVSEQDIITKAEMPGMGSGIV